MFRAAMESQYSKQFGDYVGIAVHRGFDGNKKSTS